MSYLFVVIAIGIVFWFVAIQPQRRRQQAHLRMQDAVVEGAEIITAGGLHGTVIEGGDDVILVEIAPGTVVRVDRRAVAAIVAPEEEEAGDAEEDADEVEAEAGEAEAEAAEAEPVPSPRKQTRRKRNPSADKRKKPGNLPTRCPLVVLT